MYEKVQGAVGRSKARRWKASKGRQRQARYGSRKQGRYGHGLVAAGRNGRRKVGTDMAWRERGTQTEHSVSKKNG